MGIYSYGSWLKWHQIHCHPLYAIIWALTGSIGLNFQSDIVLLYHYDLLFGHCDLWPPRRDEDLFSALNEQWHMWHLFSQALRTLTNNNNDSAAGTGNFCPSLWLSMWLVTNQPTLCFEGPCDLWPKSWSKWYSIDYFFRAITDSNSVKILQKFVKMEHTHRGNLQKTIMGSYHLSLQFVWGVVTDFGVARTVS